jgi:hypothetical protein
MRFFYLSAALFLYAAPLHSQSTLSLYFSLQMDGKPLELGPLLYHSATGDIFQVDVLRFYITGVQLQRKDGTMFTEKDSYHLVDAEDSSTQHLVLKNIPAGRYTSLSFQIGTDSLTNVAGAMGGDLDPTKGMYWAWNTGYINFKIEGKSDACKTLHHAFEFHIGGYMPPCPTVRRIVLPLKKIKVSPKKVIMLQVNTDLAAFFNPIHLDKTNQVMIPCQQAALLADYFKNVFSVQ